MYFEFFGTFTHWSWTRFKKGEFVEDESYEWSDVELDRRLGVRIRETKTSFFSVRFDINKESIIIGLKRLVAGESKYLFAKHMRRQRLLTGFWLICL